MATSDCPGREALAALAAGRLSGEHRDVVAAHLGGCAACRAVVKELGSAEPTGPEVRGTQATDAGSDGGRPAADQASTTAADLGAVGGAAGLPADAGRHLLFEEIGRGGMGRVFRGRDPNLRRDLAVKLLRDEHRGQPGLERRFVEEAQVGGQLQHPGIVPVHELGRCADGRPFFTMKLVRGRTLDDLLAERPSPADDQARFLGIFEQVCQTLAYAHSRGVIHRDLKPSNVMVGAFGEVQVMDWGLAKVLPGRELMPPAEQAATVVRTVRSDSTAEDGPTGVMGTPAYMAPEQARGEVEAIDERADVFGLGGILCAVLTGQSPYPGGGRKEVLKRAEAGDLAGAFDRLAGCGSDAELVALARECLAPERTDRPRDAGVVAAQLAAYLAGVRERLRRAELERAAAEARAAEEAHSRRLAVAKAAVERRARRLTAGLAAALVLLVLAGGGAWLWHQQRRQAADAAAGQAMARARLLLGQAEAAPLGDPGRFREAQTAAASAEELAQTGPASAEVRRQAADLVAEAGRERETAARDRRLLAALREVGWLRDEPSFRTGEGGRVAVLAEQSADEKFVEAFQEWDPTFDVDTLTTEEAAARLRGRRPEVRAELIAALDEWASERRREQLPEQRWRRVAALAAVLDDAPGSVRGELRALLARGRLGQERALSVLAAALGPGPVPIDTGLGADRQRLRRLADQADVAHEPVLGLLTLARALAVAGDGPRTERLLRAAVLARPQEAVLYQALGQLLVNRRRWRDAVECLEAARALRPELGAELASALVKTGRVNEGLTLYERLEAQRPNDPWLRYIRGNSLLALGRPREAEKAFREAIALQPSYPQVYNNLGNALADQGRLPEAEAAYRAALHLKPDLVEALNNLGIALFDQARYKEAEASFRATLRLQPNAADTRANLGAALNGQERFKEAEAACRQALRLQPDLAEAHLGLGNALDGQGRPREAEAACREAIRLLPGDAMAHSTLGNALLTQGRPREAEAAYREAIRLRPGYAKAFANLGGALCDQSRFQEAEAACREAIRLRPDLAEAHANLGNALNGQARFREAEAALREALRHKPDEASTLTDLGDALNGQGRYADAEAVCRKAIAVQPGYSPAHNNLGMSLQGQGKLPEAEAAYRAAIRLQPDLPRLHTRLATLLLRQRRYREAEAACREAIRLQPGSFLAHVYLGNALKYQGRLPEAETAYRETIRLKPDYAPAHNNLGNILNEQGRFREAEAAYREAIRLDPDYTMARYNLANALSSEGRYQEAEAALREVLRRLPDLPEGHCNLGHALQEQGRFREALAELRRGDALGRAKPGWKYRSGDWVRQCARLVELDRKLPAVLRGEAEPANAAEGIELAHLCGHYKQMYVAASRLYDQAFAAPGTSEALRRQNRFEAACSAALAAAGQGQDARLLPDPVVRLLRRQARRWLRDDLALYARMAEGDDQAKDEVRRQLALWCQDTDLASVRDAKALGQLADAERREWRRLWDDVAALLRKVTGPGG
jgi:tetratricopeptide (TPR) repeat protein/tRNA A-37 threonylcarbamoyl transferase component Bud32